MRAVVLGVGAVGSRAARQLASSPEVTSIVISDREPGRTEAVARSLGPIASAEPWHPAVLDGADVLVLCAPLATTLSSLPAGRPIGSVGLDLVEEALGAGIAVVSVADGMAEVEGLLRFRAAARAAQTPLIIGAGMAPGLTDVLARQAAVTFDAVDEIHVAKAGTGGPACARQHHRALGDEALDWRDGEWARRPGGSGREICWFPDPVGGRDCYRAGLPDALLLHPAFPGVRRITARMAATRRDRLTSPLPMMRQPHPEGELGAVRVEVRGQRQGGRAVSVLGALDRPGVAAGAVAALSSLWAVAGRFRQPAAGGLAELLIDPAEFLTEMARRGVKAAVFEGVGGGR